MNQLSFSRSITDTHVRRFVGHHVEGLRNAAHVLGGDEGCPPGRRLDGVLQSGSVSQRGAHAGSS